MKTYIDAVLHNAWLLFYLFLFLATIVAERDNTGSGKKRFFFGGGAKTTFFFQIFIVNMGKRQDNNVFFSHKTYVFVF